MIYDAGLPHPPPPPLPSAPWYPPPVWGGNGWDLWWTLPPCIPNPSLWFGCGGGLCTPP